MGWDDVRFPGSGERRGPRRPTFRDRTRCTLYEIIGVHENMPEEDLVQHIARERQANAWLWTPEKEEAGAILGNSKMRELYDLVLRQFREGTVFRARTEQDAEALGRFCILVGFRLVVVDREGGASWYQILRPGQQTVVTPLEAAMGQKLEVPEVFRRRRHFGSLLLGLVVLGVLGAGLLITRGAGGRDAPVVQPQPNSRAMEAEGEAKERRDAFDMEVTRQVRARAMRDM